ncbi:MAG: Holliday junction branch migration protein RuvA [Arenicellales bacterium]|nr:Holliday junction branch migration protein RuvA [Arenicellales bacterium]
MIAYLKGTLLEKHPPTLVLDVDGVGYELEAPMTTFYDLTGTNTDVVLHTHMVVREDAQKLYGFTKKQQRDLFRSLLKVTGVGPRVGLAILSSLSTEEFLMCMADEDVDRLTRVPGIGRKTAQRLLVEMRDRVLTETDGALPQMAQPKQIEPNPIQDAVSALIALGYKPAQASRAVREVDSVDSGSEEIIRQALRMLAGSAV